MKLARKTKALGLLAFASFVSPLAMADDPSWYVGANIGRSKAKIDDPRIIGSLLGQGLTTTSINDDDRSTGFKVFGGYQFNPYFAVESGYFDLGKFGYTANTSPAGTLDGRIKLKGINIDAVGTLPLFDKLSAFGRVGLTYAQAKDSFTGTGAVNVTNPNPSKRDTNYKLGVGLQYAFTDALTARLEAERYRINDAVGNKGDINLISVGLLYRFGGTSPAPRAAAPVPVVVTPKPVEVVTPPAPPPPPVVAAPPAPRKVSFSADSLFDFGKATIKPTGKQHLDKFSNDLRGATYSTINVTGHTDRIGSRTRNEELSKRRAEGVKTYLVDAGIPASKITARGAGATAPVTKPGECKGTKATPKHIACLQPDRRVEVEVSGTR